MGIKEVIYLTGVMATEAVKNVGSTAKIVAGIGAGVVSDKINEKKSLNSPIYCKSKEEFVDAMNREYKVIVVKEPLYDDFLEEAKKIRNGKKEKVVGTIGVIAGILASSGLGLVFLGGGIAAIWDGKNKDSQKEFKVKIDELKKEIVFTMK